jgi:hypothetical protein
MIFLLVEVIDNSLTKVFVKIKIRCSFFNHYKNSVVLGYYFNPPLHFKIILII